MLEVLAQVANVDGHDLLLHASQWGYWQTILCKRGVIQVDPLYSLLFVLIVDILESILNTSIQHALINQLIVTPHCPDFPVTHYVDDTVMIVPAYTF